MRDFESYWRLDYMAPSPPFLTRVFSQRIGAVIAWLSERAGLSPNMVTLSGLPVTVAGCLLYTLNQTWAGPVLAFLLFQLSYAIDCADGQLARATLRGSSFGAWLDVAVDHARNILLTMTVLFHQLDSEVTLVSAILSATIFGVGATISLHAFAFLKAGGGGGSSLNGGLRGLAKSLVKLITDTPLVLAALCLLWFLPDLLTAYLAILGFINIVMTLALAKTRLLISKI